MERRSYLPPGAAGTNVVDLLRLKRFRMASGGDGGEAYLELEVDQGGQIIPLLVAYPLMSSIQSEVDTTAESMTMRLRFLSPDRGAEDLAAIARTALRPDIRASRVFADPVTGESIYVLQFANHAPLALRFTQAEILALRRAQNLSRSMLIN
jgi:hypothetical protein